HGHPQRQGHLPVRGVEAARLARHDDLAGTGGVRGRPGGPGRGRPRSVRHRPGRGEALMLRSVSIQLMWDDRPFPARAEAAAAAGFDLVDLWDRRTSDLDALAAACRDHGIGINGFFGNRDHGLCDPDDTAVLDEISRSLDAAAEVGARQLHVFSNAIRTGGVVVPLPEVGRDRLVGTAVDRLAAVADAAAQAGVTLVLEHLNTVFLPGYLWDHVASVVEVAARVDRPEVRVAFDAFHQQLVRGR